MWLSHESSHGGHSLEWKDDESRALARGPGGAEWTRWIPPPILAVARTSPDSRLPTDRPEEEGP